LAAGSDAIRWIGWLLLIVMPLAIWKLVDIVIWLVEHVSIKP